MQGAPLTLGTAGHIDHGKTALIEALTGVNTDRLPQERERGISIELGFTRLDLPSGRALGVVDVPGHERFVRAMVAGATGVDMFLLVVAADDGVMPQTREHLAVLELLEVGSGVVALTKADLVDREGRALAAAELADLLAGTPYTEAPVVAVSAAARIGMGDLLAALERAAGALRPRALRDGPARLHVDRSFTLRGIGTVVTGTLWSGELVEGADVRLEPHGRHSRIRSLHVHDRRVASASAGQRVALNLAGVDRAEVHRGDVVVDPGATLAPTYLIDASARVLPGARPLRAGSVVHVHHGTRDAPARVVPLEAAELGPGQQGLVQLRLQRPLVAAAGDRFVLRRVAPPDTVAGGIVLDPSPRKHGAGSVHVRPLRARLDGDPLETLRLELEADPSGVGAEAGEDLLEGLVRAGEAARAGHAERRWFTPTALARARTDVLRAVAGAQRGVGRGALARMVALRLEAVSAVVEELVAAGTLSERAGVVSAASRPRDPLAEGLAGLVRADRHAPRAPDALAREAGVTREEAVASLDRLAAAGTVVRVAPGIYFDPEALAEATDVAVAACERDGSITIAGLRDALGIGRKHAQAILEYLDSRRIMRREGDRHVLRARRF